MCGIVGILSSGPPVERGTVMAATRSLHHRGPDLQKVWVDREGAVGLGSARLSIIDLDGGDQPLSNEDGSLTCVVNGELYAFERIRRRLQDQGHRFATGSDSEIVLHLYEQHGIGGMMPYLRGEFAFILWDARRRRLLAARDRFGIKPLFYSRRGDGLYLASEIKALAAAGLDMEWDEEAFFQQLFICLPPDRSLFAGVRQLPGGHLLVAEGGAVTVERYWDIDYPLADSAAAAEAAAQPEEEHIEALHAALDEAVRLRLRADVPVGCFLSGGVDSSAVLGLASPHAGRPIRAFHVSFTDDSDYDELEIARETAALTGAEFHPLPMAFGDFSEHLDGAIWHAEALGINPHGVARYLQAKAVHQEGYKVVLSGEGSDEILAGYSHARQDLARQEAGRMEATGGTANLGSVADKLGFVPAWLRRMAINRSVFHALLAPDYAARMGDRDPYRLFLDGLDVGGQMDGREPLLKSLYIWSRSILPNYILFAERLEMAHSIEVRLPFLDHHVVEAVRRMPVAMLVKGMTEKYVLREAAKGVLTETVYRRHKHPFTAPPATERDNRLQQLMQETLRGPQLARLPFFDQSAVVALLDQLPHLDRGTRIALDAVFLMVVCTAILDRRFVAPAAAVAAV